VTTPYDDDLRIAVEHAIRRGGPTRRVVGLRRRPSDYRTSFPIEEIDAELDDGTRLALVLKDPCWNALTAEARRAKPAFLHDPLREIDVYESVLPDAPLGPPTFYGTINDRSTGRHRLLLERVAGRELYQVGEFEIWREAARWLAGLHARFAGRSRPPSDRLLTYDGAFFRLWPARAVEFASAETRRQVEWLANHYERVVEQLLSLPPTLLHGDFYASNILTAAGRDGPRVCAVDWEMAGWGPGPMDLAAVTAGCWSAAEREALALAYYDGLRSTGVASGSPGQFFETLDWCRLHLAVQWLGWSGDWSPPAAHAHDWLGEAVALAGSMTRWGRFLG
jgi:hypothetical protein